MEKKTIELQRGEKTIKLVYTPKMDYPTVSKAMNYVAKEEFGLAADSLLLAWLDAAESSPEVLSDSVARFLLGSQLISELNLAEYELKKN